MRARLYILILLLTTLLAAQKDEIKDVSKEVSMKAEMALIDGQKQLMLENYAKALELFQTALEINPYDAAIHYKIAQVLYHDQDFDGALKAIEAAMELDGENKFFYVLAADIEIARSDLPSAQKFYERLLNIPGNEDYLGDLALLYKRQGKFKKALETFDKVQNHFGTNEALVREKQSLYQRIGEPEKVIPEWERLVQEYPTEESYFFTLCELLLNSGQDQKARKYLENFLQKDASNARAGLMMAEILKKSGNYDQAMDYARSSLLSTEVAFKLKGAVLSDLLKTVDDESKPEFINLLLEVATLHPDDYTAQAFTADVLFQLGEKEKAIDYYLKATGINPGNFAVWQNILSMEAELNRWNDVIKHAEKAMQYFPNQAGLYYFAGTGYLRAEQFQRSVSLLEMGKRFAIEDELISIFNGQLGDAYYGLNKYAKSDMAYEEALEANPNNEHVLNNFSYYLSLRKVDLDKALEMSSRLIKINEESPTYLDTHGWVLFNLSKYKEAKKYLEKAIRKNPSAQLLEHYGDILFKLGMENEALIQWEKAREKGSNSPLLQRKINERKYYE